MEDNILKLNDGVTISESYNIKEEIDDVGTDTDIQIGYTESLYVDENGLSQLGEVLVRKKNKVVAGGLTEWIAKMFGAVSDMPITTLNEAMGIAMDGTPDSNTYKMVCLFNVGLEGCGAAYTDVKVVLDQSNIVPGIIPFRVVDTLDDLGNEKEKYWFRKETSDGKIACYLKRFENSVPVIKHFWKDSGNPKVNGTPVTGNPSSSNRKEGMEHFVEIILRITVNDFREYFELYDDPKFPRFNSLGLCMGQMGTLPDGTHEYVNVEQFSILNMTNEPLHFEKDLSVIYRVYLA